MTYRAAPITQRDGSALANSNCRCASIATGIDYHSLGAKTSTGKAMRAAQEDQSGGTDSGDAARAWSRGYAETLRIMDGATFDDAKADLLAGRLVHLDIYAATLGGVCLSGSGSYGHTIAVAPERHSDGERWLVADPWCQPASWSWTSESKLRAAAEEWGRQVYGRALEDPEYPTGGPGPRDPRVLAIVARIVKRLMDASYPGGPPMTLRPYPDETGGGAILYTTTKAHDAEVPEMAGPTFQPETDPIGLATVTSDEANIIATADGEFHRVARGYARNVFGVVRISSGAYDGELAYLVSVPSGEDEEGLLLDKLCDYVPAEPSGGDVDELAIRQDAWDEAAEALIGARPE